MQMNATLEPYQPSSASLQTRKKLDKILEKINSDTGVIELQHQEQFLADNDYKGAGFHQARAVDSSFADMPHCPFEKRIEKVLSCNEMTEVRIKKIEEPIKPAVQSVLQRLPDEMKQIIHNMSFLVKFKGVSYLHSQWMPGQRIVASCDVQSIQILIQFAQYMLSNKNAKPGMSEAMEDNVTLAQFRAPPLGVEHKTTLDQPLGPILKTQKVSSWLELQSQDHPFFNPEYLKVEKVLSTPTMYPLLHASGLLQVRNTWKDECLRILDVLLHIQKDNHCFGLKFSAFDPAFSIEQLEEKREQIESCLSSPFQVLNITQLQNLLFNKGLARPSQFWNILGKIFKAYIILDEDEQSTNRQFCAMLRCLSLYLFKRWKSECQESYHSFREDLIDGASNSNLDDAFAMHSKKKTDDNVNKNTNNEYQIQVRSSVYNQLQNDRAGADDNSDRLNQALSQVEDPKLKIEDLQLFQQILNQNEQILKIQKKLCLGDRDSIEIDSLSQTLNLFLENQKLLQRLLFNYKTLHPQINQFEKDVIVAKQAKIGSNDQDLINLRNMLLTQNSYALEQLTRRKILGSDWSSSNNQNKKGVNQNGSGTDSSSLIEKPPIFIFSLLQGVSQDDSNLQQILQTNQESPSNEGQQGNQSQSPPNLLPPTGLQPIVNNQTVQINTFSGAPASAAVAPKPAMVQEISGTDVFAAPQIAVPAVTEPNSGANNQTTILRQTIQNFLQMAKQPSTSGLLPSMQSQVLAKPQPQPLQPIQPQPLQQIQPKTSEIEEQKSVSTPTPKIQQAQIQIQQNLEQQVTQHKQWQKVGEQRTARHELSWLLFDGETENEIRANPYLFEDDMEVLLQNLFVKDQTKVETDLTEFEVQKYYLDRIHKQGPRANTLQPQERDFDSLSFEPLFLVKWKQLSYESISWEPLSALKGDNFRSVQEFLAEKRHISMRGRLINSKTINNHIQLLKIEQDMLGEGGGGCTPAAIFEKQKALLDSFIASLLQSNSQQRNNDEVKSLSKTGKEALLKNKNFKLLDLQKRSLNCLEQAFLENRNQILADQKGLGKRVTLISFLSSLKFKHKINGPFLVITKPQKLAHWKYLLDKWTELRSLVYHDSDRDRGMENLRRWAIYHLDVTVKGRITARNQLQKFDVLLTTVEHVNNESDPLIRKFPFMQVIIDHAEVEAHRLASTKIACKRIICSTSNPMPNHVQDLAALVNCVDPMTMEKLQNPERVFSKIGSLSQLQNISGIMSPFGLKNFQHELENLFGQLHYIELEVQMTPVQRLFYKEIYEQHGDLISKLSTLDNLSQLQKAQIELIDDLLHKCCSSIFLIDKEQKLMEKCHQFSKRELKSNLKQQLVSGKMHALHQIVESLQKSSKKTIICSHYPHMLVLLKKYFKETGVACFMYQPLMSIDSVFRFNLYSGQAVFLLQIGQKWSKEECSYFDLDFIQNIVIFDQRGSPENVLINLFQVCTLPFNIDVNVYRLICENSYEQKMYQRQQRSRKIQNAIFKQDNLWNRKDDFIQSLRLEFPLQLNTREECSRYINVCDIPTEELDNILRLSTEQVVLHLNQSKIDRKMKGKSKEEPCFTQSFHELLTQHEKIPQLQTLIDRAKLKNSQSNNDQLLDLYENLKSLDRSSLPQMPSLKSANFYCQIFGLDFGSDIPKERKCNHLTCTQLFIEKLSESSSIVPNQASTKNGTGQFMHNSWSRTRTRESYNIGLVKLLKNKAQLGRQHKSKTLFNMDFMKRHSTTQGAPFLAQPIVDKMWITQGQGHQAVQKLEQKEAPGVVDGMLGNNNLLKQIVDQTKENMVDNLFQNKKSKMIIDLKDNVTLHGRLHNFEEKEQNMKNYKALSEDERQDIQDYEDIKNLKQQKKTSEDNNTLKKSLDQANNEESDDHTIEQLKGEGSENENSASLKLHAKEDSYGANGPFEQNQPDKKLSNGNVCQICFFLVDDPKKAPNAVREPVLKCGGPCQNIYHKACAQQKGIIVPGSIKEIIPKSKGGKAAQLKQNAKEESKDAQSSVVDGADENEEESNKQTQVVVAMESFMCHHCDRNEAQCYICKEFDQINTQPLYKDKAMVGMANETKSKKLQQRTVKKSNSSGEFSAEQVEKCIVGSCQKYYHFGCLQQNQNVDIYTNNKNQTRFRCPLHYCSGCSISGNSVQILQCVACPTSYHLKCFRADRGAIKLTKKFILCGQHKNSIKKMQKKRKRLPTKNSVAGYSFQQKIEQHKRHQLNQQIQMRKNNSSKDETQNGRPTSSVASGSRNRSGERSDINATLTAINKSSFYQNWQKVDKCLSEKKGSSSYEEKEEQKQNKSSNSLSREDKSGLQVIRLRDSKANMKAAQRTLQAAMKNNTSSK